MSIPRYVSPSDAPTCARCGEPAREYTSKRLAEPTWLCANCAMALNIPPHDMTAVARLAGAR